MSEEKNNEYCKDIVCVLYEIEERIKKIFDEFKDGLILKLADYNLLSNDNNCIETSTATGFIVEEFVTTKLVEKLTDKTKSEQDVKSISIKRLNGISTVDSSYDCYAEYNDTFFMINFKVQKNSSKNNAVAAINKLYKDYVETDPEKQKSFLVIKILYKFERQKDTNEKVIKITGVTGYALESIDFSKGHKQDHRNWSENYDSSSGRLMVSDKWYKDHQLEGDKFSYKQTKNFINEIKNFAESKKSSKEENKTESKENEQNNKQ